MKPNSCATAGFVLSILAAFLFFMPPLSFIIAVVALWTCLAGTILSFFGRRGLGLAFPGLLIAALMVYVSGSATSFLMSLVSHR